MRFGHLTPATLICVMLLSSLAWAQRSETRGGAVPVETRPVANRQIIAQPFETGTLIELFTSQGCSSCPPADALLAEYASRPHVVALSFPIDYWDYLGWKDTLASPRHAERQHAYAKALRSGNVYTPQVVVNGVANAVGSNRQQVNTAVDRTKGEIADRGVKVAAVRIGEKALISVGAAPRNQPGKLRSGTVWLAVVKPKVDVTIGRGENRGRTLTYHNVVRELTPIGMWTGEPLEIELPADALLAGGHKCAVFLQTGKLGRVIGATWMRE